MMTLLLRKLSIALLLLVMVFVNVGCSSDDNEPEAPQPQILFLFSPGGLGDMSYNDCILQGIQRFKREHEDIDTYIYSPGSLDEAERIFSDWLARPRSDVPVLFVFASSDYEPMVEKHLAMHDLTDNKWLLLFESRKQFKHPHINTFQISMFGASYLAGSMAARMTDGGNGALVVLANNNDGPIAVAKDGFLKGYGRQCDVKYLADDWTGYVAAGRTYQLMSEWAPAYDFIFPVAGGSNAGVYRYSREYAKCPYLAGMDIDQSGLSNKITGSVIKQIDKLAYEYLVEWVATRTMPESQMYGLESGYVDWGLSPGYKDDFVELMNSVRPKAIEEEKNYYEADGL